MVTVLWWSSSNRSGSYPYFLCRKCTSIEFFIYIVTSVFGMIDYWLKYVKL